MADIDDTNASRSQSIFDQFTNWLSEDSAEAAPSAESSSVLDAFGYLHAEYQALHAAVEQKRDEAAQLVNTAAAWADPDVVTAHVGRMLDAAQQEAVALEKRVTAWRNDEQAGVIAAERAEESDYGETLLDERGEPLAEVRDEIPIEENVSYPEEQECVEIGPDECAQEGVVACPPDAPRVAAFQPLPLLDAPQLDYEDYAVGHLGIKLGDYDFDFKPEPSLLAPIAANAVTGQGETVPNISYDLEETYAADEFAPSYAVSTLAYATADFAAGIASLQAAAAFVAPAPAPVRTQSAVSADASSIAANAAPRDAADLDTSADVAEIVTPSPQAGHSASIPATLSLSPADQLRADALTQNSVTRKARWKPRSGAVSTPSENHVAEAMPASAATVPHDSETVRRTPPKRFEVLRTALARRDAEPIRRELPAVDPASPMESSGSYAGFALLRDERAPSWQAAAASLQGSSLKAMMPPGSQQREDLLEEERFVAELGVVQQTVTASSGQGDSADHGSDDDALPFTESYLA